MTRPELKILAPTDYSAAPVGGLVAFQLRVGLKLFASAESPMMVKWLEQVAHAVYDQGYADGLARAPFEYPWERRAE